MHGSLGFDDSLEEEVATLEVLAAFSHGYNLQQPAVKAEDNSKSFFLQLDRCSCLVPGCATPSSQAIGARQEDTYCGDC